MKKVDLKKGVLFLALIAYFSTSLFAQTESGLSLGKLRFIQAPPSMKMETRSIKMTMSRSVITPRFCARIGGVAFVQVAEPAFPVESISLICDKDSNAAFAMINGEKYRIPLGVWELEPIVKYANSPFNAAVTLYGTGESRVKFHEAFIDKLMGLRVLQTDLLLASNYLEPVDRIKLPANQNGVQVMSESEKNDWHVDSVLCRLFHETSPDTLSLFSSYLIEKAKDSIGEDFTTYIYTDFGEPITFDIVNGNISISGRPYYRFTRNDEIVEVDETYDEVLIFLDSLTLKSKVYSSGIASRAYQASAMPKVTNIRKIADSKKDKHTKAQESFKIMDYYKMHDSLRLTSSISLFSLNYIFLSETLTEYVDSISMLNLPENDPRVSLCTPIRDIIKDSSIFNAPVLAEYAKEIVVQDPTAQEVDKITSCLEISNMGNDDLLIYYTETRGIHEQVLAEQFTNYLKERHELVRMLNPVVIDASVDVCRWAAFFRYAKVKNPSNWKKFVKQVDGLTYDAPQVSTPIRFRYK